MKYKYKQMTGNCGCPDSLWHDRDLGIWRCRNCGWCS